MDFYYNSEQITSDVEGTRFAIVPQIGMSGVSHVRVGVMDRAMQFSKQSHSFSCNSGIVVYTSVTVKKSIGFYLVTATIILELHSNVSDYLYDYHTLRTYIFVWPNFCRTSYSY